MFKLYDLPPDYAHIIALVYKVIFCLKIIFIFVEPKIVYKTLSFICY